MKLRTVAAGVIAANLARCCSAQGCSAWATLALACLLIGRAFACTAAFVIGTPLTSPANFANHPVHSHAAIRAVAVPPEDRFPGTAVLSPP